MFEDDASGRSDVLRRIYRVRVGRVPAATPVHSTDVCCSRIQFSEMIPRVSTHAASQFPRDTRARGSRRATRFGELTDVPEHVPLRAPSCQRASDTSSPGGLPWRSCVHQRRPAIASATSGRTRRPRPRSARPRETVLTSPRSEAPSSSLRLARLPATRSARPLCARPFSGRVVSWRRRELLPCHRPSGDSRCPGSPRTRSSRLAARGCASGAATPSLEAREPLAPVRDDQPPAMATSASREATTALHTGEDARIEVIVPSVRVSSSRELAGVRRSRSPPTEATSTPPSSSDDHRDWVLPGIFSADLGLPPPPATLPPRTMASRQVPSTVERARGRPRSRSSSYGSSLASPPSFPCGSYPGFPQGTSRPAS
jgi:hypothetical protein